MSYAGGMTWLDLPIGSQWPLFISMNPALFREPDNNTQVSSYIREWATDLSLKARGIQLTPTYVLSAASKRQP